MLIQLRSKSAVGVAVGYKDSGHFRVWCCALTINLALTLENPLVEERKMIGLLLRACLRDVVVLVLSSGYSIGQYGFSKRSPVGDRGKANSSPAGIDTEDRIAPISSRLTRWHRPA